MVPEVARSGEGGGWRNVSMQAPILTEHPAG
jgi:hypothetical protein